MRSSASIALGVALLLLFALNLVGARIVLTDPGARLALKMTYVGTAVLSGLLAWSLWTARTFALRLYIAWALVYLFCGAIAQALIDATPFSEILIWWVFVGAVLVAVGVHLRYELRLSGRGDR